MSRAATQTSSSAKRHRALAMHASLTAAPPAALLGSRRPTAARLRARASARPALARRAAPPPPRASAADDASSDAADAPIAPAERKMVVAVTGATGFVGKALVARLQSEGHEVRVLTRNALAARLAMPQAALAGAKFYAWDTMKGKIEWYDAVRGCTGVVNLAGAPIANPWSEAYKKTLVDSRLRATKRVADAINALPADERPTLVTSSAVGYYGASKRAEGFDETSRPGKDFLADLCVRWEAAARRAKTTTTVVRTGVVLEKDGGALGKMLPAFRLYAGGPLGAGDQYVSWVHRDDLTRLVCEALREPAKYEGVVNGVAPTPVTMAGLCESVAEATGRPNWLPVPGFALRAALGEGAAVVLDGQKVLPKRAEALGFEFQYEEIDEAMEAIV